MKLNLGCGQHTPAGWVNVDWSIGARFAKVPGFRALNRRLRLFDLDWDPGIVLHDLTTPFPWADGSVEAVYSSHTLEHLDQQAGLRFLQECHRVLQREGIIRLVLPDLRIIIEEYLGGQLHADDLVAALGVLYKPSTSRLKNRLAPLIQFPHRCMYDEPRLLEILDDVGFKAGSRDALDSELADIREVELADRTCNSLVIEGRKR